ncbi:hypothetical protein EVAR_100809_1 [Eumeta japonica]|uniref:Uncharacterized protein n=1 Tax=Eumeta variegata TaxID=151549 RepID=A0A4C2A7B9_EUMVA|nr:hypothetical protein EVAR_100809_1 [Eumeta japonica]
MDTLDLKTVAQRLAGSTLSPDIRERNGGGPLHSSGTLEMAIKKALVFEYALRIGISVVSGRCRTSNVGRSTRSAKRMRLSRDEESSEKREAGLSQDQDRQRVQRARESPYRLIHGKIK